MLKLYIDQIWGKPEFIRELGSTLGVLWQFLKDNGDKENLEDYKPKKMRQVDVSKLKEPDSNYGLVLTNANRNTSDHIFFWHLYGMNKLTMMWGGCPLTVNELRQLIVIN